jgi:hypothetical protein
VTSFINVHPVVFKPWFTCKVADDYLFTAELLIGNLLKVFEIQGNFQSKFLSFKGS